MPWWGASFVAEMITFASMLGHQVRPDVVCWTVLWG
jgi:hypothetical protein